MNTMSEHLHVPVDKLEPELTRHIPAGDPVIYTTHVDILKLGFGAHRKSGNLAVTQNGIAFRAAKVPLLALNIVSATSDAFEGFIPYAAILEFKNHHDRIQVKYHLQGNPREKREWLFKAERCQEYGEDKPSFDRRKNDFGAFIEAIYRQRRM
jgi:hypothetical protein